MMFAQSTDTLSCFMCSALCIRCMEGTDGDNNNEIDVGVAILCTDSSVCVLSVQHQMCGGHYGNTDNDIDVVVAILCTDVSFCVVSVQRQMCGRPQRVSLGMPTHGAGWRCQLPMAM